MKHMQKVANSKKSLLFVLSSWNLVKTFTFTNFHENRIEIAGCLLTQPKLTYPKLTLPPRATPGYPFWLPPRLPPSWCPLASLPKGLFQGFVPAASASFSASYYNLLLERISSRLGRIKKRAVALSLDWMFAKFRKIWKTFIFLIRSLCLIFFLLGPNKKG